MKRMIAEATCDHGVSLATICWRCQEPHTPLPWFRQGSMVFGPDEGGIEIGLLIAHFDRESDAALVVQLVNDKWRSAPSSEKDAGA